MIVTTETITKMEKIFRGNFVNSLSGFKSATLIGTVDKEKRTNLALFSSIVHIGANPPLIGFIMRPVSVPRHTYENIKATGYYTINHIHKIIFKKAHHTSARFPKEVSEFKATGLTEEFLEDFPAPFVKECRIKLAVKYSEEYLIQKNGTILIIGEILKVILPDDIIKPDGYVDIEKAGTLAISGLDCYHTTSRIERLPYAKP